MEKLVILVVLSFFLVGCEEEVELSSVDPVNWDKRTVNTALQDTLVSGVTYLSVYSQIYGQNEHRTFDLTATVSMRNTSKSDTIFVKKASYYDTHGEAIRDYFDQTIFIAPMETVEIIIDEVDQEGGTGGNFLFEWSMSPDSHEPLFEAVMISTSGQQGLSFTTSGVRVN